MTMIILLVLTFVPVLLALYVVVVENEKVVLDETRYRLFSIRASLFEMAAGKKLNFSGAAYGMLRDILNGSIRFTHDLSFIRMLFLRGRTKSSPQAIGARFNRAFDQAKERLPADVRQEMEGLLERMNLTMVIHVFGRSILLTIICFIAHVAIRAFEMVKRSIRFTNVLSGKLKATASSPPLEAMRESSLMIPVRRRASMVRRIDGEALSYVAQPMSLHVRNLCPA